MKVLIEVALKATSQEMNNGKRCMRLWGSYEAHGFNQALIVASDDIEMDDCPEEWENEMKKILLDEHVHNLSKHSLK